MAFPPDIPTRVISVGGAMVLESSALLRVKVTITASKSLVRDNTGYRFERLAVSATSELGSEAQIVLPRTDVPGWKDAATNSIIDVTAPDSFTHKYTALVEFLDTDGLSVGIPPFTVGPFVLPLDDGSVVDLDKMVPSSTVAGETVSVPGWWGELVAAAEASATAAAASLLDSDSFVAGRINTPSSLTSIALTNTFGALSLPFLGQVFTGFDQISYGHSFLAEQGLTDVTEHWARRFASAFGMTYPTSAGGSANDLKRAVGGTQVHDSAARVLNTAPYVPGTKQLVVIENLINSSRLHGNVTLDKTAALNAMRAIMAGINADSKIEETSGSITFSVGTWSTGTVATASGGSTKYHATNGGYFEFTAPDQDAYVLSVARGGGTGGATFTITDQNTAATLATLDLSDQALGGTGPYAWRIPASARGHVVRFTKTGGTSMYFDALIPQSLTPPPVLWMKEPYLNDYSLSTSFPNGSDAATDAFNALIDTIAAEFPNVIVANPNTGGYWTKAAAAPGGLVQSDGVHPSAAGGLALFQTARDALLGYMVRRAVQVNLSAGTVAEEEPPDAPFDLLTDTDLVAFYSSASLSGLADGAQVATWSPTAGIETTALARSSAGERPIMSTGAVYSGKRGVIFDGVDDDMAGTFGGSYTGTQTVLVIGAITTTDDCILSLGGSGVVTNLYSDTGGLFVAAPGSAGATLGGALTPSSTYRRLGVVANGATSAIYVDGTKTPGTMGAATGGNVLRLGETNSATKRLTGGVVAVAIFRRALTDSEVADAFTQMVA